MHPSRLVPASLLLTGLLAAAPPEGLPRFEPQTIDDTVEIGYGIAVGDVDGDGAADILLVDKREISWFRNPDWEKTTLARNLTPRDNVCIAADDIDGDGKVEIAVGAQWNPGETMDKAQSGAVFYLSRPAEASGDWTPVPLPHDPTTHRMRWMQTDAGPALVVVPLHGIGNRDGTGENTVNVRLHRVDPTRAGDAAAWADEVLGAKLHVTHNLDIRDGFLYIAGAEGIVKERPGGESILLVSPENSTPPIRGAGEIAVGRDFIATVEPFHGTDLAVYR
ncbi:MAG TPA: VCBS repeat-containing protein, partial [Bacteroidia bacterium]|nr:VCBS repeat-containing protein [Bacteroidia bacterium]